MMLTPLNERVTKAQAELDKVSALREAIDPNQDDECHHWYYRVYADREIEAQLELNQATSERDRILSIIA